MAIKGDINSKNSKTLSLRKLLEEEREKFALLWVPGCKHFCIILGATWEYQEMKCPGATEKYPPQDLINWIKTEDKTAK
jgi:hypothetical protein